MSRSALFTAMALLAAVFTTRSVFAQGDFYKGKNLQIIVASGPGAGNDLKTRIFARHASKHLPGNPNIIVENMPGAGGLRARNHLYNLVKPDGFTIAQIVRGTEFQEMVGDPGVKYKSDRFHWLGNLTTGEAICALRIDRGGTTLEEAIKRSAITPLRDAESGAASIGAVVALLVKEFTGLKVNVVSGYSGGSAIDLAIEKGEADMRCGLVWSSAKARHAAWFRELGAKKPFASVIVQISEKRLPELSNVPTLIELASDNSWRAVAEAVTFTYENAYPMLGPPGLSQNVVNMLRKAFWQTVKDPEYVAESEKSGFTGDEPVAGDKVQKTVKQILSVSDEARSRIKKVLGF